MKALVWGVISGAVTMACGAAILNADPKTGGACRDGDQLGTLCKDGSCAPNGYRCAYDGQGWEIDEPQWGPGDVGGPMGAARGRDAGRN